MNEGYYLQPRIDLKYMLPPEGQKFTKGEALTYLRSEARYKPCEFKAPEIGTIWLEIGDIGESISQLARKWKWGKHTVIRYLKELADDGILRLKTDFKTLKPAAQVAAQVQYNSRQVISMLCEYSTTENGTGRGTGAAQVDVSSSRKTAQLPAHAAAQVSAQVERCSTPCLTTHCEERGAAFGTASGTASGTGNGTAAAQVGPENGTIKYVSKDVIKEEIKGEKGADTRGETPLDIYFSFLERDEFRPSEKAVLRVSIEKWCEYISEKKHAAPVPSQIKAQLAFAKKHGAKAAAHCIATAISEGWVGWTKDDVAKRFLEQEETEFVHGDWKPAPDVRLMFETPEEKAKREERERMAEETQRRVIEKARKAREEQEAEEEASRLAWKQYSAAQQEGLA